MHIHYLDPYKAGESIVHRTDARVKLVLGLGFIVVAAFVPVGAWALYFLLFVIILALEIVSDVGVGYYLKRSSIALPFILAALPLLFTIPGPDLFGFTIGPLELSVRVPGVERFTSIALKSWISIQMAILITATTAFPEILTAMRSLKVPRLLVAVFGLMWRYLFVFADEAIRLLRARAARSGGTGNQDLRTGGDLVWRAKTTGGLAGNLFIRSLDRGERIYLAMLSRGYDGEIRSLPQPGLGTMGWIVLVFGAVLLGLVFFLSLLASS